MTNVVLIDHARIARDERRATQGSTQLWGALRGSLAILNAKSGDSRAGELKVFECERLRRLLQKTVAELAIHDSPEGMIQYTTQLIGMYRTGSCSNE